MDYEIAAYTIMITRLCNVCSLFALQRFAGTSVFFSNTLILSLSYPFNSITEKLLGIVFAEIKKANYAIPITKS